MIEILPRAMALPRINYSGPLTKGDAQRLLDLLIGADSGTYTPPDTAATVATVSQGYLAKKVDSGAWGAHMVRAAGNIVTNHIIAKLGQRPIAEVSESELQTWLNEYVAAGSSKSLLTALKLPVRAIFKRARKQKLIIDDPTEDLYAKSTKRVGELTLTLDQCRSYLFLNDLPERDRMIFRVFVQLGLRPEDTFALRRNDPQGDQMRIDEALVEGQSATVKTEASDDYVYIPPDLQDALGDWMERFPGEPTDWSFQTEHGRRGLLNANNYRNRVLKPAAGGNCRQRIR